MANWSFFSGQMVLPINILPYLENFLMVVLFLFGNETNPSSELFSAPLKKMHCF